MRSDIDRYKRQVARLDLSGIDFAAFREEGLAGLHLIEGAVERYAADRSASGGSAADRSGVVHLQARRPADPDHATAA